MAQLRDLIVNGASRLIGDVFTNKIQITAISAPTASNGTTYGPGANGQVLKSNGTSVYWAADDNSQTVTGVKGNSESSYRTGNVNITAANIGLGNVENTKLSTWAGSANITTLGTISSGTVPWARLSGVPAGASKEGTVTSITLKAGTGISLDTDNTAITTSGTRTITNSGVRATTINGNYLRVNTNGTNADLTIPYATSAGSATSAITASKLGSSNVGAADRPIYLSNGTATQTTYRMSATNAGATGARAITENLDTGNWYVSGTSDIYNQSDGVVYAEKYSDNWIHEIYGDYCTGQIAVRGKNNGTWQAWRKILDSTNYTDYTVTKTGTGASGTWGISISGNAATATSATSASSVALSGVTGADDLKAIEALTGTSGLLKKTAANTWTLDTTAYIPKSTLSGAYDIMYSSAANTPARLAANTTATKKFLRMTGTGSAGAAPAWDTVTKTDVGLSAVENKSSATIRGELTSSNVTTALGYTPADSDDLNDYLPLTGGTLTGPLTIGSTLTFYEGSSFRIKYGTESPETAGLQNGDIYFYIQG